MRIICCETWQRWRAPRSLAKNNNIMIGWPATVSAPTRAAPLSATQRPAAAAAAPGSVDIVAHRRRRHPTHKNVRTQGRRRSWLRRVTATRGMAHSPGQQRHPTAPLSDAVPTPPTCSAMHCPPGDPHDKFRDLPHEDRMAGHTQDALTRGGTDRHSVSCRRATHLGIFSSLNIQ